METQNKKYLFEVTKVLNDQRDYKFPVMRWGLNAVIARERVIKRYPVGKFVVCSGREVPILPKSKKKKKWRPFKSKKK